MATSKVKICNMAISNVGGILINSLNSPYESTEAQYCDLFYDQAREDLLRDFVFNFSVTTKKLALLSSNNDFGFAYTYSLPADFLKAIEVVNNTIFDTAITLELVNDVGNNRLVLKTDVEQAYLKYITNVTETSFFDPLFIEGLVYLLASKIAVPIQGSSTGTPIANDMLQKYSLFISRARSQSGNEEVPEPDTRNHYVTQRWNYDGLYPTKQLFRR